MLHCTIFPKFKIISSKRNQMFRSAFWFSSFNFGDFRISRNIPFWVAYRREARIHLSVLDVDWKENRWERL
jgi:hypothetical protein